MNILVTGGAGYIGSHTSIELINAGYEVIIVDNLCNSNFIVVDRIQEITGKKVKFYKIDATNKEELKKVFVENKIDAVIHFAALKAVGESVEKPLEYYSNNLINTINVWELMKEFNVYKFVFSSSATVYGSPKTCPIKEDFPLSTTNPYGSTKLMIENMLRDICKADKDFNVAILRYFNPIGAHESGKIGEEPNGIPNNLMPYITKVAVGKLKELSVFGNDYDTHDGTGTGYSVLDLVKSFEKASGVKIPYKIVDRRAGDIAMCYADPSKAKEELGWVAKYDIDKMCKDSWNWQSKNPNGYNLEEKILETVK